MIIIVMGGSGSGKTTVGSKLAADLGWQFCDADDFHPMANVRKMRHGIALTDDDRRPWLQRLQALITRRIRRAESGVLACSSLKRSYRAVLTDGNAAVRFVYLRASRTTLEERLHTRRGHFMNPGLLESQLATLEEPDDALVVDASLTPQAIVDQITNELGLRRKKNE